MYLITTFPSLKIDIELYPAIKQHLLSFGFDRLKQTGDKGARKKTNNQWFETQDSIGYWEDFYKQKIVWKAVGKNLTFSLLEEGKFLTAPASFITSNFNLYILAFLQSKYGRYFIYNNSDTTGAGDIMLNIQSLEQIPIPIIDNVNSSIIQDLVYEIIQNKSNNTLNLEMQIDKNIYKLFDFDEYEIHFIDSL